MRRDHVNSLWQKVQEAYDMLQSALKAKYNQTYSTYKWFAAKTLE